MFDLKELEAFASVMHTGSLTASARAMDLPKSTMSRRIRQLEDNLGQSLLRRESNRLIPTEAGHLFHRYCQEILKLADHGRGALEELREEVSGELCLYCHDGLLRAWFAPLVKGFMQEHAGVQVELKTQTRIPGSEMTEGVCLWLGQEPDTSLHQEHLGVIEQGVYAGPEYLQAEGKPRHPRDLAGYNWVDLFGTTRDGFELCHSNEPCYTVKPPVSSLKVDRFALQVDAIVHGQGMGLMPHWMVNAYLRAHPGALEPCLGDWRGPALDVYLIYPYGHLPRRVQTFLRYVREAVPDAWGRSNFNMPYSDIA